MRYKRKSVSTTLGGSNADLSVAFVKRVRPTLLIAFFTSILVGVFGMKSTYSVQSCQNMQTSIKIVDESGGKRLSGTSLETLQDSPFKTYVTTISKHISTKIKTMPECQGTLESRPEVALFFVYRPLVTPATTPFSLERSQSNGDRRLDSPWVKLSISRSPKLFVQSVFVWSERQFLFDQALMSGARASPDDHLLPIDERIFGQFVRDYTNSVLLSASPETESAAQVTISKRLPVEILWLFRHALQSTFVPFSNEVDHTLRSTVQSAAGGYTDLTNSIVDRFFASTNTFVKYKSVSELKNVFAINKYKIH